MAIDETKFGELIGTVGALVTAVADMKAAIVPMVTTLQKDLVEHKEKDAILANNVATILEWKNGANGEDGAEKTINNLEKQRLKTLSFVGGVAMAAGAFGHKIGDFLTKLWG